MPAQEHTGASVAPKDKAVIHSMSEMGHSKKAIAKTMGFGWHTVKAVLSQEPTNPTLVAKLKQHELSQLVVLGALSRDRLAKMLDENLLKPIEAIALMDRAFQQVRLIQGESTANIDVRAAISTIEVLEDKLGHDLLDDDRAIDVPLIEAQPEVVPEGDESVLLAQALASDIPKQG